MRIPPGPTSVPQEFRVWGFSDFGMYYRVEGLGILGFGDILEGCWH